MRAPCRTLLTSTALGGTRVDTLSFPRNEGVPGSSPGVGFVDLQGFSLRWAASIPVFAVERVHLRSIGLTPLDTVVVNCPNG